MTLPTSERMMRIDAALGFAKEKKDQQSAPISTRLSKKTSKKRNLFGKLRCDLLLLFNRKKVLSISIQALNWRANLYAK